MIKYAVRRIFFVLPTLWAVVTFVFIVIRLVPGGPAVAVLGTYATAESIRELEKEMGIDKPILVQYINFLGDLCKGDFGKSMITKRPVATDIAKALPYTIDLTLGGMLIGILLGVPIGIMTALKRNRFPDYAGRIISLIGISIPEFYLGIILMYVFAIQLDLFPVLGGGNFDDIWSRLYHLCLPALTLGLVMTAFISRMVRSSMLNVLKEDYVRTARAKGLREFIVVYKHALRNALIPTVTVIGIYASILMGGSVLTEIIYSRPGLGKMMVFAVKDRDYIMLQSVIIIFSGSVFLLNLLTDLIYSLVDPRIEYH